MKKEILQTFIRRYSLGNLITKAKWKYNYTDKILHTRAAIDNKSFIVDVIMNDFIDFGQEDNVLCIGNTEKVISMMSPFNEDISISVNKNGDKIIGFTMSDPDCESYCTCADPTAIDAVPKNIQDLPEFHVEIQLTEDFIDKLKKANMALKDVDTFSVGMNKKGLFEIVIGYSTSNSNRIRITPPTDAVKNKIDVPLSFPIKNIIQVLKANSDIPNGIMSINNTGIIKINVKNDKFTCNYFQFNNKKS